MILAALDLILAATLVSIATQALTAPNVREAVLAFVVFGLLLAIVWVRLAAPDVALAEAAVGAGITGALLLEASAQLAPRATHDDGAPVSKSRLAMLLAPGGLVVAAALSGWVPTAAAARLSVATPERLATLGIAHLVTAVLLGVRAFDTLLEVSVLLTAVLVAHGIDLPPRVLAHDRPFADGVVRRMLPLIVLVSLYLLWAGTIRTGGAFQAAAVLAGGLLLARFTGIRVGLPPRSRPLDLHRRRRRRLVMGPATFIAVALAGAPLAGAVLAYPPGWAPLMVLGIEAALTASLAWTLVDLFGPGPAD